MSRFGREVVRQEDQMSEAVSHGTLASIEENFRIKRRMQELLREPMV